ncbi:uncharacterized protein LOC122638877 [Telopea speciosissima]|uniref:uncharacterized protein LOC122638877 n=1 Tax=Telopea speciosissima TaxID=54955 RepID=UPI001CC5D0AD|nr:uncharacterized protein LOC122638877 [Telopea speciosissima]
MTDQPLKKVLHKPDVSGRLIAWAVELSEYQIKYKPRTTIKGQALADFVVECIQGENDPEQEDQMGREIGSEPSWTMFVDRLSNFESRGAGFILTSPEAFRIQFALRFVFPASNNEAEYEALIAGLKNAKAIQIKRLTAQSDSQLVVNQINGDYEAKDDCMAAYLMVAKEYFGSFKMFEMQRISRSENKKANALSRLSTEALVQLDGSVYVEKLSKPSHQTKEVTPIKMEPNWMDPIVVYLRDDVLPKDRAEARRVRGRVVRYTLVEGELYKRSVSSPLLRCLTPSRALYALAEVHMGICGSQMGGRHLAYKVLQQGLYWPNIQKEVIQYVKSCEQCQKFMTIPRQPVTKLASILSPIPFAMWGMDMLGNITPASGGRKYLVVAVDYFTKWVEAEPLEKSHDNRWRNSSETRSSTGLGCLRCWLWTTGSSSTNQNSGHSAHIIT